MDDEAGASGAAGPLAGHHGGDAGAGGVRSHVHAHARRLRRPGDQGGEPQGRRLRPALRRCGERPLGALRVDQPGQGVGGPGSQVTSGNGRVAPAARPRRHPRLQPHPRHHGQTGPRPGRSGRTASGADRGRDRRVRSWRAPLAQAGVRPARPGRDGIVCGDGAGRGAGQARAADGRRVRRAVRGPVHHGVAVRAGARRPQRSGLGGGEPVRHDDGADGLSAHLHQARGRRSTAHGHGVAGGGAVRGIRHGRRSHRGPGDDERP